MVNEAPVFAPTTAAAVTNAFHCCDNDVGDVKSNNASAAAAAAAAEVGGVTEAAAPSEAAAANNCGVNNDCGVVEIPDGTGDVGNGLTIPVAGDNGADGATAETAAGAGPDTVDPLLRFKQ